MRYQRYLTYKDSGVAWLGQVPAHWEVKRLKHICSMKSGETINADSISDSGDYAVYGGNGLRGYTSKFTHFGTKILIGRQGALCGNINYAHGYFWASEHAIVVENIGENHYYFLGELLHSINLNQYSTAAAQPGISVEQIKNLFIPLPPLAEQQAIAAFLDRECAQIDTLVAAQQRLIALLKEKRQALIAHTVTQGLDPAAPRKDSGVAWLGQVPAHWEVKRLKHSVKFSINGVWGDEPQNDENDVVCIRVADFERNSRRVTIDEPTIRNVSLKDKLTRGLKKGNLLLEKSGGGDLNPVGFVALYQHDIEAVCSNFIAKIELNDYMSPEYWCYFHASAYFSGINIKSIKQTSGIQNLDQSQYLDELATYPPLAEQQAIAAFLDRECAQIDTLVAKAEQAITLLHERRSALIAAAVTGQIRVDGEELRMNN